MCLILGYQDTTGKKKKKRKKERKKKERKKNSTFSSLCPHCSSWGIAGCCLSCASRFRAKTFRGTRGHPLIQWNVSIKWEVCQLEELHINHRLTRIFICLTPLLLERTCLCLAHTAFYLFRRHCTELQLEGTGWSDDTVKGMQDFLRIAVRGPQTVDTLDDKNPHWNQKELLKCHGWEIHALGWQK